MKSKLHGIFAIVLSVAIVASTMFSSILPVAANSDIGDYEGGNVPLDHEHNYVSVVTAPSCTEQGYTTHTCSFCNDSYVDTYTNALGHTGGTPTCHSKAVCTRCHEEYGDFNVNNHDGGTEIRDTIAATCTEVGYTGDTYCLGCGIKLSTGLDIPVLGHAWGEWTVTTDPTCTEKGIETRVCSNDQTHIETRDVNPLGHNYSSVVTNPTCTEVGYTGDTYCLGCGNKISDGSNISALSHAWGEWTVTTEPTCTVKGVETRVCANDPTHIETRDVNPIGHSYNAVVTDPTCTERGYTTHTCSHCKDSYIDSFTDALGHTVGDWLSDGNEHWHYCTVCQQDVDKAAHISIGWTIDTDATYETVGHRHKECIVCGYIIEEEDIPIISHEHNYVSVVTDPTCTEQGYTTHTCSICSSSYVDSFTDALGHTGGTATCHSKAVCTRCLQEYGEFDANNHDGETEIRNAVAATCTEKGYTGDTYCLSCGNRITSGSDISALGHDYNAVVTNPTCTEGGYTTHTCSRCKGSYVDTYTNALGHTVGDWISNANEHWHYCTECEQDVDKAAHTTSDWIVDTDATAETAGHKHKECTVCGYVMAEENIPVTPSYIPGDINNDGKVNNKDLTRLFQYLSKWNVEVNQLALDVNGDTKVNNKDLTRLFQYLSKWDVQIF